MIYNTYEELKQIFPSSGRPFSLKIYNTYEELKLFFLKRTLSKLEEIYNTYEELKLRIPGIWTGTVTDL